MTVLSTADIQKALTVAATQDPAHITSPGAVDGLWGRNTQSSFDSWVAMQSPDLVSSAGLLVVPANRATRVDLPATIAGVFQSLAAIWGLQPSYGGSPQQVPAGVQRTQAAATAAQVMAAATQATTPAQRAAASAAISPGAGGNARLPMLPQSALLLLPQQNGPLGVDWWIWGLIGAATVATAGGLYWYYGHGKKHRPRHHRR